MREDIGLFRGKRLDNGEWVEGYLSCEKIGGYLTNVFIVENIHGDVWERHRVDPATVGEYTGLKDKNGKRIFEGDVLEDGFGNRAKVVYGDWNCGCCYSVYGWTADGRCDLAPSWQKVVGNIVDNPELLEV